MPDQSARFKWVAKVSQVALVATIVVLALKAVAAVAVAVMLSLDWAYFSNALMPLAVPVIAAAAVLTMVLSALWLTALYGLIRATVSASAAANSVADRLGPIETLLEDIAASNKRGVDLASLSDQAKSLIFRDREIEAFRETIQADLMKQDYASAETLIDTIEKRFGYADEAVRLRAEVANSRKATKAEKVDIYIGRIQEIVNKHDWARALREAGRLAQMFPDQPKAVALPGLVEAARNRHKRNLLQEYGEAVRKNDIERSIALLRELDKYLTPQEGAALAESARGVFRAKLHNLGVQFAISVADEQWTAAVTTGEEIVTEFPNTRMAHEVREKMELLKARATAKK